MIEASHTPTDVAPSPFAPAFRQEREMRRPIAKNIINDPDPGGDVESPSDNKEGYIKMTHGAPNCSCLAHHVHHVMIHERCPSPSHPSLHAPRTCAWVRVGWQLCDGVFKNKSPSHPKHEPPPTQHDHSSSTLWSLLLLSCCCGISLLACCNVIRPTAVPLPGRLCSGEQTYRRCCLASNGINGRLI